MNKYKLAANLTKADILEQNLGIDGYVVQRPYLSNRKKFALLERVRVGPYWRYRRRNLFRNLDFSRPVWMFKVRRKLNCS